MSTLPQHLSLVTLGVADLALARSFYTSLGLEPSGFESEEVVFFDMRGVVLALFSREALAEDAGVSPEGSGFRATSLAFNVSSEAEVAAALNEVEAKGGRIVRAARKAPWGGYSGYFADPDGHLWEVAYNPGFPLDSDGRLQIPPPRRA
jgi:catechol 2,3-dioxygenase-like lactoylglutathione lyase family enzyme